MPALRVTSPDSEAHSRAQQLIQTFGIDVEELSETESSLLLFGRRADQPVVLKVVKLNSDEWRAGEILKAFRGQGVPEVLEYGEGAHLIERILPGKPLSELVLAGNDNQATDILASLIDRMSSAMPPAGGAHVEDWALGFDRYLRSNDSRIPKDLVVQARDMYTSLCETQKDRRLLHGDLHHANVLYDANRGWLAIDPKGVIGETECEIGVALRNPNECPQLVLSSDVIESRIERFTTALKLDFRRTRQWAFAQAVLSAIWGWEDQSPPDVMESSLKFAATLRQGTRTL